MVNAVRFKTKRLSSNSLLIPNSIVSTSSELNGPTDSGVEPLALNPPERKPVECESYTIPKSVFLCKTILCWRLSSLKSLAKDNETGSLAILSAKDA